jgi:hypothetical protein
MNRFRFPIMAVGVLLTIAACDKSDPVQPEAKATAGLPQIDRRAPSASGEVHGDATVATQSQPAATMPIPAKFHGRWGLAPGDCTSTKGDAKGLLVVGADGLRFYESRAVPGADADIDAGSISGHFNFTGEGRSWSRYEALRVDGARLVRTESNPAASFSYAKCD